MRYDLSKKMTSNAKRTLEGFRQAFEQLLLAESFDDISVNEFCDKAGYPRATFYNYFSDKYDFLDYYLNYVISSYISPGLSLQKNDHYFSNLFLLLFDMIDEQKDFLKVIIERNTTDSYIYHNIRYVIQRIIKEILTRTNLVTENDAPIDLWAEHYANTGILVIENHFLKYKSWDKQTTYKYFLQLINNEIKNR